MAFDVISPAKFGVSELDIAPDLTTIRTTPEATRDIVKTIDIANTGAAVVVVALYLVPDGAAAGVGNALIPSVTIPGNSIFQWSGAQVTNAGDTIQASATLAGVCVTISGGEAVDA